MPNHFVTVGLCAVDWKTVFDQGKDEPDLAGLEDANLCEIMDSLPDSGEENLSEWTRKHWGTKWGTYDLKVRKIESDGAPVLIEFQSAWGPPHPEMMRKITDYLRSEYCLINIKWIGHDPFDGKTMDIEVAQPEKV